MFLRQSEVLLNSREIEFSIGFNYSTNEYQRSFRKNRSRSISIPLDVSYGLTRRLELNASLPFVYNENEVVSVTDVSDASKSGIGDISLGLLYLIKTESITSPSVTASLNIIAPTGEATNPNDLTDLSTGAGFWGVSANLSFSKSIDPTVVFFSIGYQYTFEDEQFGLKIQPGTAFNYGVGIGFSVNSLVSLSGRISGSYQNEVKINHKVQQGTTSEPISLIWSMSYRLSYKNRLEVTVRQGVADDADDVGIGFSYIWNL